MELLLLLLPGASRVEGGVVGQGGSPMIGAGAAALGMMVVQGLPPHMPLVLETAALPLLVVEARSGPPLWFRLPSPWERGRRQLLEL